MSELLKQFTDCLNLCRKAQLTHFSPDASESKKVYIYISETSIHIEQDKILIDVDRRKNYLGKNEPRLDFSVRRCFSKMSLISCDFVACFGSRARSIPIRPG